MGRLIEAGKDIQFTFNGKGYKSKEGDSIATALFVNSIRANRKTYGKNASRGSYCFMGVCFECLVKVDGLGAVQGCKTKLCDGMKVEEDV